MSGLCAPALRTRSGPSPATATTSKPPVSSTRTIPSRTSGWSSPTTTLRVMGQRYRCRASPMGNSPRPHQAVDMIATLVPASELEQRLLETPEIRSGLAWGNPRWGHPGGSARAPAAALPPLTPDDAPLRDDLRVPPVVHDPLKTAARPRQRGPPNNAPAVPPRRFTERFTADERLL